MSSNDNNQSENPVKTAALYARVSTLDQEPENQLIALRNYAKTKNFKVFDEYVDKISGIKESRPDLNRLMMGESQNRFYNNNPRRRYNNPGG